MGAREWAGGGGCSGERVTLYFCPQPTTSPAFPSRVTHPKSAVQPQYLCESARFPKQQYDQLWSGRGFGNQGDEEGGGEYSGDEGWSSCDHSRSIGPGIGTGEGLIFPWDPLLCLSFARRDEEEKGWRGCGKVGIFLPAPSPIASLSSLRTPCYPSSIQVCPWWYWYFFFYFVCGGNVQGWISKYLQSK